ncbi:MAG: 16S rRNA (adenine(1518)-N(6)/adenine(1519)-N(6))-dimethyltransferase RsmA [Anaerolineales bacterium]|nr:16S rRNA (adenine(1518)-N(6)/adenine(1519)-N(6))-dimethyltransferase RsmA [Anaerolineales bacterium]
MLPLDARTLLRRHNVRPKKRLGQNFLVDDIALGKVAAAAELQPDDTVLEIGPGLGSLTRYLAEAAQRVIAVEVDGALLPALEETLRPYDNVEVIQADILRLNLASVAGLSPGYCVVANIPYYITSAIVRHLVEAPVAPSRIVLTVQREVAERMVAQPDDMNLLAVSVQFYTVPRIVARLPAGAFFPRPGVDSAIVRLDVRPQPAVPAADITAFFRVVKAGFSQRRKQLRNALAGGLRLSSTQVDAFLAQAGIGPQRRAETLSLSEWSALAAAAIGSLGPPPA